MVTKLTFAELGMEIMYFVGSNCVASCMGLPEQTAPNMICDEPSVSLKSVVL